MKIIYCELQKRHNEEPLYNSQKDVSILQELVNKTVSKKIHISRIGIGICSSNCPTCEEQIMFSEDDLKKYKTLYCTFCGQLLEEE